VLKNYIKIALRNLMHQKVFSSINIVGLAIGLACGILLSLWIFDEISFDKFHENGENIYRVLENQSYSSQSMQVAVTPIPLAESMKKDFPEIVFASRYNPTYGHVIKFDNIEFSELHGSFTDKDFLKMFSFPVIKGNTEPLSDKNSIILTEETTTKFFGDDDAIGKIVSVLGLNFQVTAIIQNIPVNSQISFDYILPFQVMIDKYPNLDNWGNNSIYTYLQLADNTNGEQMSEKIQNYLQEINEGASSTLYLQPIFKTHLHSVGLVADLGGMGDFRYIILFSIISVFIIIISSVNFISLSTARYTRRAKEVGLRKVVGSRRSQLIWQFLGESMILLLISLTVALVLAELCLPAFNNIASKELSLVYLLNPNILLGFTVLIILIGFLTGIYPAFLLSSFKPVTALKSSTISGSRGSMFRKIMVVTQWSLSIILIISTLVISKQLQFMKNKKLGFDKEHIVYTNIEGFEKFDELKEELLKHPGVENVSTTMVLPHRIMSSTSGAEWEGKAKEETFLVHYNIVNYDFIETFKIEMVKGRSFSEEFSDDTNYGYILNQEAIRQMGLEDPINKKYSVWDMEGKIIGVMKDFHFKSLHNPIEPIMFLIIKEYAETLVVRVNATDTENTISYLENTMAKFDSEKQHKFRFFDERYEAMYNAEQQIEIILKIFTGLAIFVACLGLFGLSTFLTQQRIKEIGIRKVLGANIPNLVITLSKEFTKWIIMANLIACPLAYYIINKILQNFAYRVNMGTNVFVITIVLSILIAILTVSFQTIRVAYSNPVKALKYE